MEVLAENCFTITKPLCYEGMQRISAGGYGKFARKAVLFLIAAWLILTVVTLWQGQSLGYIMIEFIVLCMVSLWICVYVPRNKARRAFKALESKYGDDLKRSTCFYENRLVVKTAESQKEVLYSEIAQVLYSPRLLILVTEDNSGILLKLDSFTCGSETTVQNLIKNQKEEKKDD